MIENVKIYGLNESKLASHYPMATDLDNINFNEKLPSKLGKTKIGSGHDQFLTGIVVQFDLTFSLKAWTELQRYHFIDFVSSQSTMHRITKMNLKEACNEYVLPSTIARLQDLVDTYNNYPTPENYLYVLYNMPTGLQLTARMTTNYRQLKTIHEQRFNHRLPEWKEFCYWVETLPEFQELCLNG